MPTCKDTCEHYLGRRGCIKGLRSGGSVIAKDYSQARSVTPGVTPCDSPGRIVPESRLASEA